MTAENRTRQDEFDQRLAAMEPLHFHPLVNSATTAVSAADFREFVRACGHTVVEVTFPADGPA